MKNWRLWILLGGFIAVSAAFLFLNFHAAVSSTQSEKNVTKTSIGDGMPLAMEHREPITIVRDGEGPMASTLQAALERELRNAGIGEIELAQGLEPVYPNPVLILKVGQPALNWTPFFAYSQFTIQTGYTSTGDTLFMSDAPVTMDNKNGPALAMHGEYKVNDRSWGLISRPGYHQILADYLAQQIVTALKELYRVV